MAVFNKSYFEDYLLASVSVMPSAKNSESSKTPDSVKKLEFLSLKDLTNWTIL